MRDEHDFIGPAGKFRVHQTVAFLQINGDDAGLAVVGEIVQAGFLHRAVLRGENNIAAAFRKGNVIAFFIHPAFQAQDGRDGFFRLEIQQVLDIAALRAARRLVNLIHAVHVHAPGVRKEHQVVVVLGGEQVFDKVRLRVLFGPPGSGCLHALASARLHAVFRGVGALDVAAVRDGDDHRVIRDKILNGHIPGEGNDARDARRGVLVLNRLQFVLHDAQHAGFVRQNIQVVLDADQQFRVFPGNLVVFQSGQLVQAQVQDGVHLAFREDIAVPLDRGLGTDQDAQAFRRLRGEGVVLQAFTGFIPVFGIPDNGNEVIHVVQGQQESFQALGILLRVPQQVARAAHDHLTAVLDVEVDGVHHGERLGAVVMNRQHVHRKGSFHGGELVKLVHDHLRACIPLQLDFNAGFLVRKVPDAGNVRQNFILVQFRDAFLEGGAVHAERHFPDDEKVLAGIRYFHVYLAADAHGATPGAEVAVNA